QDQPYRFIANRSTHTNFVRPGTATGGVGSGPHAYAGGVRSSFDASACSQVISLPVYAAIRPRIASSVLFAMYSPLLIGRPAPMPANSSSCSAWYISFAGPSKYQVVPAEWVLSPCGFSVSVARPLLPTTWALMSLAQPGCCRQLLNSFAPLANSYVTLKW